MAREADGTGSAHAVAAMARIVVIANFVFIATAVAFRPPSGILLAGAPHFGAVLAIFWLMIARPEIGL